MASPSDEYVDLPGADSADYQAFLDDYSSQFTTGDRELVHGHVLSVSEKEVIVDIGRKSEGLVPASQFPLLHGKPAVKPGDVIDVMFDRAGEPVEGYILLSYERAHKLQIWDHLEKAAADGTPVTGSVVDKIKGGLTVDIGVIAFLPSSQVDLRPAHSFDGFIGQQVNVRILKLNRRRGNAVVSRRILLEEEMVAKKSQALAHIQEGAEVSGTVKSLC